MAAQHPSLAVELAGQCPQGPDETPGGPSRVWVAHGPITSRDAAAAGRRVLATRRLTVRPAPDAIGATHRVAANRFKVRANIRTPGPRRPSHANRTP